ncbi:MAG: hypothetical protein NTV43_13960 [Methylococcales bacterium]|nr:hypothetical protein [Methylococcales bacterium]
MERSWRPGEVLARHLPHRYLYDQFGHLLGEYDNTGTPRQKTVWLGDLPVAVILPDGKNNTQAPNPRPVPRFRHYHIHADHLNTPRAILDTANRTVWRWDNSDAFGNGSPQEDPDHDGKRFTYNLRFPGQYFDAETGLHYNMTRYYSPAKGRYIQSDRIGLAGGLNTYVYVGGNPVNFIDPLGLFRGTGLPPQNLVSNPTGSIVRPIDIYFPPMGSKTDPKDLPNNVVKFPVKAKPTESCPSPDDDGDDPCEEWLDELVAMSLSIRLGNVKIDDLTKQAFNNSVRMFKQSCPLLADQIAYLK